MVPNAYEVAGIQESKEEELYGKLETDFNRGFDQAFPRR